MTVKELRKLLKEMPDDAIVAYYHNQYASMVVENVSLYDQVTLKGKLYKTVLLEGGNKQNAVR